MWAQSTFLIKLLQTSGRLSASLTGIQVSLGLGLLLSSEMRDLLMVPGHGGRE